MNLRIITLLFVNAALAAGALTAQAKDWPSWRGPQQNGSSPESAIVTDWSPDGKNLLWKVPVGGRSTPVILNNRLYAIGPVGTGVGRQERVICLDIDNGRTIWEHRFNVFHTDIVENRVGWTSLTADPQTGNIYAHGTAGELFCFDRDGEILWKHSASEVFGRISGYGGRLHNPVIDRNRVIYSFSNASWGKLGKPLHRYLFLDKNSGQVLRWVAPGHIPIDKTCYSTPVFAVIDGQRQMIAANGDGSIYGTEAQTGQTLWSFHFSKRGMNASVVVDGNFVYACHSEENIDTTEMGRIVCIDASKRGDITQTGEVWRIDGVKAGYASPAIANGRLYVADNWANLHCINARNGELYWKYKLGRVSKASPTVTADGVIYVGEVNGTFHVLRDAGDKCESLCKTEFATTDGTIEEILGSAAVADGRVYFTTRYNTYCLAGKGASAESPDAPPSPAENAPTQAFHIVPADLTLEPGQSVTFQTSGADGGQAGIQWSVAPGLKGAVTPEGTFTAAPDNAFSAGHVVAKYGEQQAAARVRITRKPPFTEDFEAFPIGKLPAGWIGVGAKSKIVQRDGSKVLKKLAEKPSVPFMRMRAYSGPPIEGGCTVQCDILGSPKVTKSGHKFRPDMGLINSRYRLELMSTTQQDTLRINTWSPLPRLQKDVPFDWKADLWYRFKFTVQIEDGQALLRGKVWPRDEAEPHAWSIELTDPYPNTEGSPGLYGYSPGTTSKSHGPEIFYDNYEVTLNE